MSNITLLHGNDQLEDSMLRSILLFNAQKTTNSSKDLLLKAILSIITYGDGKYGLNEINNILKERFDVTYVAEELNQQISKLKNKGLIIQCPMISIKRLQIKTRTRFLCSNRKGNRFFD